MEDWVKQTKSKQNSKTYKVGVKQAAKVIKGQHAHEMAFAEAGSENVNVDVSDGNAEMPDDVTWQAMLHRRFSHPRSAAKCPIPS